MKWKGVLGRKGKPLEDKERGAHESVDSGRKKSTEVQKKDMFV